MNAAWADVGAWVFWPVVLVLCAATDALFCGMESGLYVLNKIRLELRAEAGWTSARFLRRMLRNSNNLLAVLLIGTNLCRYCATFCITSMFVLAGYAHNAEWLTIAVASPLFFVTNDAGPKSIFRRSAEVLVYRVSWLLRIANVAFNAIGLAPLVRGIASIGLRLTGAHRRVHGPLWHENIPAIVAEGRASGALTPFQSAMANRVMQIKDVELADVMRPMREVVSAPADVTREKLLQIVAGHDYSRLPLRDADGQVVAVLDIYDVLAEPGPVTPADKAAPPFLLPAEMPVTDALYQMQRARKNMSVVADPAGRHLGIVTIKDLVEEIVGELEAW